VGEKDALASPNNKMPAVFNKLLDEAFKPRISDCLQKYRLLQRSTSSFDSTSLALLDQALSSCEREFAGLLSHEDVTSLPQALAQVADEIRASGVKVTLECLGEPPELGKRQLHECLDLVRECCSNGLKHGGGGAIAILLVKEAEGLRVSVSDNGCGFSELNESAGQGVRTMRQRLEDMGGGIDFQINSRMGTTVNLRFLQQDQKKDLNTVDHGQRGQDPQGVEPWSILEAQGLGRRLHDSYCQCLVAAVMAVDVFIEAIPEGNDEVWQRGKILSTALQELLQFARHLSHKLTDCGADGIDIDSILQWDS